MSSKKKTEHLRIEFENIGSFCKKNKGSISLAMVIIIIAYGMKLFHICISHDTEAIISIPEALYKSWIELGRYGLIFLKRVLGTYIFNPYITSAFLLVAMCINVVVWEYLFYSLTPRKKGFSKRSFIFPVFFFVSAIMVEQLSFTLQSFEVVVAMLFVALSILMFFMAETGKSRLYHIPSIVLAMLAFATYQSMAPLFVAAAAACFLLLYLRQKEYWNIAFKLVGSFVSSLFLYLIINKVVQNACGLKTDTYLSGQILWRGDNIKECCLNIIYAFYQVITGRGVYYNLAYTVALVMAVIFIISALKKHYKKPGLFLLALFVLYASPFMMTILMGNMPTYRTQIILGFVYAAVFQFFASWIDGLGENNVVKKFKYVYISLLLIFAVNQVEQAGNMFYTEYVQYNEDVRVAEKISERIETLGLGEEPELSVVFIGRRVPILNRSVSQSYELLGKSFFELSFDTNHGSFVMNNFMNTLGYPYKMPTAKEISAAQEYSTSMPSWPEEESVQMHENIIIVKLS